MNTRTLSIVVIAAIAGGAWLLQSQPNVEATPGPSRPVAIADNDNIKTVAKQDAKKEEQGQQVEHQAEKRWMTGVLH